jgi:plastocyanin
MFAVVATLALAGCGDDDSDSGSGPAYGGGADTEESTTSTGAAKGAAGPVAKDVVATIEVEETEFKLDPANPGVQDAGHVAFKVTNAGKITHALEVEGPKGEQETRQIAPGTSALLFVDMSKPGKYKWYCPIGNHEQQGMTGNVFIAYDKVKQSGKRPEDDGPASDGHGGY